MLLWLVKMIVAHFQAAEEVGACIFVHPWDMQRDGRMSKFWLPWLVGMPSETAVAICSMEFGGVFERFPKLRVCFAHGGQLHGILWNYFNCHHRRGFSLFGG